MPPFRIALDHAKSLGNGRNRPLVLCGGDGVAGLIRFREMLGSAMQEAGLGRWSRTDWLPHLTLLYDQRAIGEEAIDPISWAVREFVLVHSEPGLGRYVRLVRWPRCFRSWRMIGRAGLCRATSLNPARAKVVKYPVLEALGDRSASNG